MTADLLYSETEARPRGGADRPARRPGRPGRRDRAPPSGPETYDTKLWRTVAAEIGIAGLLIPEALGGAGASLP